MNRDRRSSSPYADTMSRLRASIGLLGTLLLTLLARAALDGVSVAIVLTATPIALLFLGAVALRRQGHRAEPNGFVVPGREHA